LLGGLQLGGIYGLVAFSLSIIYGVAKLFNLAHGTFLVIAGIVASYLYLSLGFHPFVIMLIVFLLFLVVGFGFYGFFKPISRRSPLEFVVGTVLITVGLMFLMDDVSLTVMGGRLWSIPYSLPSISLGEFMVSSIRLLSLVAVVAVTIGLNLYIKKSYMGKAIRAATQDREAAMLAGVDVSRITMFTFGIAMSLLGIGAVLYSMVLSVAPFQGFPITVKAFTIVVLGGIGSLIGSLVGGIMLGIAEVFVGYYFGIAWSEAVSVMILLLVLVVKPEGLFGFR
jgi:branched-chain amino acid transport system permease protein